MDKKINLRKAAVFIALVFHISGLIGILFTPYKDWFITNTCINLLLMASLIIITQPKKNKRFFFLLVIVFITGFAIEVWGTNTAMIFGKYTYGEVLGYKLFNVPLIIGVNWFIIIYCVGMVTQVYENYMLGTLSQGGITVSRRMKLASFIIDSVFLAVFFDWLMEPVAVKLGYWQWENGKVPIFNYVSWVVVSALLLLAFKKLSPAKRNIFAVHLFIIQVLFFLILRTFL